MPDDLMRYDVLMQVALRGVVKAALKVVAKSGLPGNHHFFIAFNTLADGVRMSERLRQKYPGEMTIVMQHQFYNLMVREDDFEVELSFNEIPERLVVPYQAIKGFLDPYVQFGLQFETVNPNALKATENGLPESVLAATGQEAPGREQSEDSLPKVVSLDAFRKK